MFAFISVGARISQTGRGSGGWHRPLNLGLNLSFDKIFAENERNRTESGACVPGAPSTPLQPLIRQCQWHCNRGGIGSDRSKGALGLHTPNSLLGIFSLIFMQFSVSILQIVDLCPSYPPSPNKILKYLRSNFCWGVGV